MSHPTIDNRLVQASLAVKCPAIRVPDVHVHVHGERALSYQVFPVLLQSSNGYDGDIVMVSVTKAPCNASAGIFHNNWRDAKDIKCRNLLLMVKYITKYLHYKIYNTKYLHYKIYNTKHFHVCICISI